jgi:hypothetical protein
VKRLLDNDSLDLKSASVGPGAIVYEQFGALHLYDLKSGKTKAVNVRISGDMPEVREHFVNVGKRLHNAHISPTGARAVFEARGEIITVPAEKGDARNLTNTTAVMERDPAWSPDGKTIAYFSDESGEYALHLRRRTAWARSRRSTWDRAFILRRAGRPIARRSPTWTAIWRSGTWTSHAQKPVKWTRTVLGRRGAGSILVAGQQVAGIFQAAGKSLERGLSLFGG